MASPIFSHLMGTLALMGIMFIIIAVFAGLGFLINMRIQNVRLAEVAESTAREVVELVSVQTLGDSELSFMYLHLPSSISNQAYEIIMSQAGSGKILVKAKLQIYEQVRVVVTPNFGENPVKVVNGTVTVNGLQVSDKLLLPTPVRVIGGREVAGKPVVVAFRRGHNIYIGFSIVYEV